MKRGRNKNLYLVLVIFILLVLAGFYLTLSEIDSLRNDLTNLELALELSNEGNDVIGPKGAPFGGEATSTKTNEDALSQKEEKLIIIPTAIIFETLSSPLLSPQTKITVTVESVSKAENGTVSINIKAFTNEATAYSALELRDLFELLDLDAGGITQKLVKVEGSFDSIPPKSAVSGSVMFKIEPAKNSIILQINYDGIIKYYELNFSNRTYKETVLG
ncbi:MAG: hypothetical protein KJI72_03580 [Patescibacteria group bacterium]|nr:hypothetical protein [Patescibacteria group bacterium]